MSPIYKASQFQVRTLFSLRTLWLSLGVVALIVILAGCGGGTVGTGGGREIDVAVKLVTTEGLAVADATITVNQTGDSGKTDALGEVIIDTTLPADGFLSLSVDTATLSAVVDIGVLPEKTSHIEVILQLNEPLGMVTLVSKNIPPTPVVTVISNTPIPTDIKEPKTPTPIVENPSATPTKPTDESPTPAPTAIATAPATATATATQTPTPGLAPYAYQGRLTFQSNGGVVSGALISVAGVSNSATTDSLGRFRIQTNSNGGSKILTVTYNGSSAEITIDDIPEGGGAVILMLSLATTSGPPTQPTSFNIQVISYRFEPLDSN